MNWTDKITVTNEDNMELMKRYPDNYFDLAIVDPPYQDTFKITANSKAAKVKKYYDLKTLNGAPKENYWNELRRVSKNQIIWGVNHYDRVFGRGRIVWDKDNTGVYSDCELAYHSFSDVTRKFKFRWNGMLQGDMKNKQQRIHPTEKPIKLYEWLLMSYAKEGDKILDTHLGSGSIAIACHNLGYELTACELDKDYYEASLKRFKQVTSQQSLF
jgi:site-specific DNA-methyltransferase (adenine-specific)